MSVRDLNDLYYFAKVAEAGSYTAAAQSLGVQTSKLSRRIGALEAELGVRLLNRTTRRLSLTEAGRTFHRHCLALVAEAQAATDAIHATLSSPQGLVRISCPTGLLHGGVAEMLSRYLTQYPEVRIALDATNRRVNVVEEGFDLALRVRQPPLEDSDLAMRSFGPAEVVLAASPALIAAHGMPRTLEELVKLPTISMVGQGDKYTWRFRNAQGEPVELTHTPRLSADDIQTLRQAALQGVGVGFLPAHSIAGDLAGGALVRLIPSVCSPSGVIHAVFPSRRGMVPAVRTLLDFLSAQFAAAPWVAAQAG